MSGGSWPQNNRLPRATQSVNVHFRMGHPVSRLLRTRIFLSFLVLSVDSDVSALALEHNGLIDRSDHSADGPLFPIAT